MELTEDEIIEKNGKKMWSLQSKNLLPCEHEFTCFSCGYNVIKRKHELSKVQRKRITFYQSLRICRTQKFLPICRCIRNI